MFNFFQYTHSSDFISTYFEPFTVLSKNIAFYKITKVDVSSRITKLPGHKLSNDF